MSVYSTSAITCFEANCDFIDPTQNPVEWNLNHGLAELAKAITGLESGLSSLSQKVRDLEREG